MAQSAKENNTIQLRTWISPDLYTLLKDFQRENELAYESEVVRMALANLLKQKVSLLNNHKNKKV